MTPLFPENLCDTPRHRLKTVGGKVEAILITGVPRTGSTFLAALYSRLGFNTGFDDGVLIDRLMNPRHLTHGGLEVTRHAFTEKAPDGDLIEVVKHPWPSTEKAPWRFTTISRKSPFEHRILTVRDYEDTIKSQMRHLDVKRYNRVSEGERKKHEISVRKHYKASYVDLRNWLETYIEVEFPRSVQDVNYLWTQLQPTLKSRVTKDEFIKVWLELANPDFVNFGISK